MFSRAPFTVVVAAIVALTGCSSSARPFINAAPVIVLPGGGTSVTLSGPAASVTFDVSENGYTGTFTASSSNTAVATVVAGSAPGLRRPTLVRTDTAAVTSSGTFTILAVGSGTATITVSDASDIQTNISVTVTGIVTGSPSSIAFTAIGQTQVVSASEAGYSGTFSAISSNPGVATVTPASGATSFTVTAIAAGMATITLTDSGTGSGTVTVGVTTTGGVIEAGSNK